MKATVQGCLKRVTHNLSECWCLPQTHKMFHLKGLFSKQCRSTVPQVHVLAQLMNKGQEQRNLFYLFLGCQALSLELAEDWMKRTGEDHLEDSTSMKPGTGLAQGPVQRAALCVPPRELTRLQCVHITESAHTAALPIPLSCLSSSE